MASTTGRWRGWAGLWLVARRIPVSVAGPVGLSLVAGVYGSGGAAGPGGLLNAVSGAWLVGAVSFLAPRPGPAPDAPGSRMTRVLLWSMVPVSLLWNLGSWLLQPGRGGGSFFRSSALVSAGLFASGVLTFVVGSELAPRLPRRLERAMQRLWDRGVVRGTTEDLDAMCGDLGSRAHRWPAGSSPLRCLRPRRSCAMSRPTWTAGRQAGTSPSWSFVWSPDSSLDGGWA
jgi:hypothetical protein